MTDSATARSFTDPYADVHMVGPDSLLWHYGADRRMYLMGPAAGVLQAMLPGVSAAIEQHSTFYSEPVERVVRSISQIMETIYDPRIVRKVRDYHTNLKGVDHHGQRYHALNPELYYAAHAVFTYTMITFVDVFHHPLAEWEKERLYADTKVWYRSYGISDRAMPDTWPEFQAYWHDLLVNGMEATPLAHRAVTDIFPRVKHYRPAIVPRPVWTALSPLAADQLRLLTTALIPEQARDTLGLEYSRADRKRFEAFVHALRRTWAVLPDSMHDSTRLRRAKSRFIVDAA